jgi:hypothetical protein
MTDVSDEVWKLERDEFAEARSHEASKISYDFGKATAQAGLIINGGAATAVIALLAKDKVDPLILRTVPWCLGIYAIGVAASAMMMFAAMMHADNWNYFWYHLAYTADTPKARENEKIAAFWGRLVRLSFALTILTFLLASIVLAITMTKLK